MRSVNSDLFSLRRLYICPAQIVIKFVGPGVETCFMCSGSTCIPRDAGIDGANSSVFELLRMQLIIISGSETGSSLFPFTCNLCFNSSGGSTTQRFHPELWLQKRRRHTGQVGPRAAAEVLSSREKLSMCFQTAREELVRMR